MRRTLMAGGFLSCCFLLAPAAGWTLRAGLPRSVQFSRVESLAAGRLLVASPQVPDPRFTESVVLLTRYGEAGAAGVIINRPTDVPLSRVLQEMQQAKDRSEPVYVGGPVGRTGIMALLRSGAALPGGTRVLADVHLIASRELLEKTLAAGTVSSALRVYLGYAGWVAGQLEREVELGLWLVFPGEADMVFDPRPDTVWTRLMNRLKQKLALDQGPLAPPTGVSRRGSWYTVTSWTN